MKPTPGPWEIVVDENGARVVGHMGKVIHECPILTGGLPDEASAEASANLMLIAAAQDLLEACEAVVRVFASKGSLTQAVIDCDHAIAKARGES